MSVREADCTHIQDSNRYLFIFTVENSFTFKIVLFAAVYILSRFLLSVQHFVKVLVING